MTEDPQWQAEARSREERAWWREVERFYAERDGDTEKMAQARAEALRKLDEMAGQGCVLRARACAESAKICRGDNRLGYRNRWRPRPDGVLAEDPAAPWRGRQRVWHHFAVRYRHPANELGFSAYGGMASAYA